MAQLLTRLPSPAAGMGFMLPRRMLLADMEMLGILKWFTYHAGTGPSFGR